jgi:hypothetical protein
MGDETHVALKERHEQSWALYDSGPDRFLSISFANARFDRRVDFSGRIFENDTDFEYARFCHPPGLPKSWIACAPLVEMPKKRGTTIENATSTSRNARPNLAFALARLAKWPSLPRCAGPIRYAAAPAALAQ